MFDLVGEDTADLGAEPTTIDTMPTTADSGHKNSADFSIFMAFLNCLNDLDADGGQYYSFTQKLTKALIC